MTTLNYDNWKDAEIRLPYWKQGDDMSLYLDDNDTIEEALETHAMSMDMAAAQLRKIRDAIHGHEVNISGDTHMILIEAEPNLIDTLVREGLVEATDHDAEVDEGPTVDQAWKESGF